MLNKKMLKIIVPLFYILFLLLPQKILSENRAIVLQETNDAQKFELYCFPYISGSDSILHLTLIKEKENIIGINEIAQKNDYKSFLEDTIKIFDKYLIVDRDEVPGKKYSKLIKLIKSRNRKWTFDKLLFLLEKDTQEKINKEYFASLFKEDSPPAQAPPPKTVVHEVPSAIGLPFMINNWTIGAVLILLIAILLIVFFYTPKTNTSQKTTKKQDNGNEGQDVISPEQFKKLVEKLLIKLGDINNSIQEVQHTVKKSIFTEEDSTYIKRILSKVNELLDVKESDSNDAINTENKEILKKLDDIKSLLDKPADETTPNTQTDQDW